MDDSTLRRLSGKPRLRDFLTVDIEALHWVRPYAAACYDGYRYAEFTDYTYSGDAVKQLLRHVLVPKYAGRWIYAHNGGNYDFNFFLYQLVDDPDFTRRYSVEVTPIGSTIVSFVVKERASVHKAGCVSPRCRGCEDRRDEEHRLAWTFVDSVRLMPLPLNELGETFGIGFKVELKMSYDELACEEHKQTMSKYLRGDCVLLYEALKKMHGIIAGLGGQVGLTLPATSLDLFRRRYLDMEVATNRHFAGCEEKDSDKRKRGARPKCNNCLHQWIRQAYFGGRSEIFRREFVSEECLAELAEQARSHTSPVEREAARVALRHLRKKIAAGELEALPGSAQMWDINSHYPHCMLEDMPVGEAIALDGIPEAAVYSNAQKMVGIVECEVYVPKDCYLPPLPVKAKEDRKSKQIRGSDDDDAKLIFPTGVFRGTWDAVELALLPKVGGRIMRTFKSVWFEGYPIFRRFIHRMYRFRDKADVLFNKGMAWIAKLLMNSNYGKWAMREDRARIVVAPEPGTQSGMKCISMEADVWSQPNYVSPLYIVPQLSVHVTALARARLWEILHGVLQKGGRIYYTDTDSVICWGVHLSTGSKLGELKHEASIKRAEFVLPKLYLVETEEVNEDKKVEQHLRIKSKGMGPGIRVGEGLGDDPLDGQLSEKDFVNLVRRGVPIERKRLEKLREGLRRYAKEGTAFPTVKKADKVVQSSYDKRKFLKNGDTTARSISYTQPGL